MTSWLTGLAVIVQFSLSLSSEFGSGSTSAIIFSFLQKYRIFRSSFFRLSFFVLWSFIGLPRKNWNTTVKLNYCQNSKYWGNQYVCWMLDAGRITWITFKWDLQHRGSFDQKLWQLASLVLSEISTITNHERSTWWWGIWADTLPAFTMSCIQNSSEKDCRYVSISIVKQLLN